MIEIILYAAPAVLAGMFVGTALGWKLGKFGQKPLAAEVERLNVLTQQQAKQIWNQADRIHELEIDKLQLSAWKQPDGRDTPTLEGQMQRSVA
jgi:hypothetical protein